MATKNEIIAELYESREFNECIGKMEPDYLRDDLRSEVVLILLETDESKLIEMHNKGVLKFFTARIIINQVFSVTSPFYKKYRQQSAQLNDRYAYEFTDLEEREQREQVEDKAMNEIDNLYWYNKEMVRLYLQHGNYRAIEEITRIPYSSAYKTIQKSFQEIKQKVLR